MKFIYCIAFFAIAIQTSAQKTETYYDYQWKPCIPVNARFYSTLQKTDSGWLRNDYFISGLKHQMQALFEDSACNIFNGQSIYFYANGKVSSIGQRIHNKNEGICLSFHSNAMMSDSAYFHNGAPVGYRLRWHPNGYLSDSMAHVNDSMDVNVSWFDNGSVSSAGYILRGKQYGKWQYFHKNGKLAAIEVYQNGKAVSKSYYDENGDDQTDTSKVNADATFKGGLKGWQQYLSNNLYWPDGYKFDNGNMAVVEVDLTIDENGKLENAEVATPFHPVFDKIALKIIQNSPNWQPCISHNRKVKTSFRQPVVFQQPD